MILLRLLLLVYFNLKIKIQFSETEQISGIYIYPMYEGGITLEDWFSECMVYITLSQWFTLNGILLRRFVVLVLFICFFFFVSSILFVCVMYFPRWLPRCPLNPMVQHAFWSSMRENPKRFADTYTLLSVCTTYFYILKFKRWAHNSSSFQQQQHNGEKKIILICTFPPFVYISYTFFLYIHWWLGLCGTANERTHILSCTILFCLIFF